MSALTKEIKLEVTPVFLAIDEAMKSGKYKYIILKGSSRSSKTYSIIDILDLYARTHPGERLTIWRDTKVDCVDTVFADFKTRLISTGRWLQGHTFNATKTYLKYRKETAIEVHGADDLASVHGLTQNIAFFNEPYKVSKDVFDQIDQRTSNFIFIDWNPRLAHWIDDIAKDERAIVIHSTFRDNPFCPEEVKRKILSYQPVKRSRIVEEKKLTEDLAQVYDCISNPSGFDSKEVQELYRCQQNEFKKSASNYSWSVYGLGEKAEQPNRIFHWQEIPLHEYNAIDARIYTYSDWGVVDPWALGDVKYYDGALYVRELNYLSENEIREKINGTDRAVIGGPDDEGLVIWMFNKLGIPTSREIICDCNRPRKITALRSSGWDGAIGPAKKQNSIIDGISALNNLKVYYTSDSINIRNEQENYARKVDRYGVVLEEPEDFNNHHCFIGKTLIETDTGPLRIDQIKKGDKVLTRAGYKKVLKAWDNGCKPVFEYWIELDTFSVSLICTPDHLIKTNNGWEKISQLKPNSILSHIKPLTGKNTICILDKNTLRETYISCIGMSGSTTKEQSRKDGMFITKTTTNGITESKILSLSKGVHTVSYTLKSGMQKTQSGPKNSSVKASSGLSYGIKAKKEENGIVNTEKISTKNENLKEKYVNAAAKNISRNTTDTHSFARIIADHKTEGQSGLITFPGNAHHAVAHLSQIDIREQKIVSIVSKPAGIGKVYDLSVEGCHEYFANGILAHNCDGIRYVLTYLQDEGVINTI